MKLLLENWRQYLSEQMEEPITTLRIFDFDETIAHTRSETRVKAPDNSDGDPDQPKGIRRVYEPSSGS